MKINRRGFFAALLAAFLPKPKPSMAHWSEIGEWSGDRYPTYGWARKVLALRLYRQGYVNKESLRNILEARIAKAKSEMDARLAQDFETLGAPGASKEEE